LLIKALSHLVYTHIPNPKKKEPKTKLWATNESTLSIGQPNLKNKNKNKK
jgi:hypothetical protein